MSTSPSTYIKRTLVILVLLISFSGWGQLIGPWQRIDKYAQSAPDSVSDNLLTLHNYLTAKAKNQEEKLRAFYVWIAHNIRYNQRIELRYDPEFLFYLADNNCTSAQCVLHRKEAVCEGYTNLFQALCDLSGIRSYVISGYVHQPGIQYDKASHSWNAVKINEQWFLIDVTWACTKRTGESIVHRFTDKYFLVAPEEFVLTHIPLVPMWQFLESPVPFELFVSRPNSIASYFENVSPFYHFRDTLKAFESQSRAKQASIMARDIAKTNSSNLYNQAYYLYRFGSLLSSNIFDNEDLSLLSKRDTLGRAQEAFQKAIALTQNCEGISARFMERACLYKIKQLQKRINWLDERIHESPPGKQ